MDFQHFDITDLPVKPFKTKMVLYLQKQCVLVKVLINSSLNDLFFEKISSKPKLTSQFCPVLHVKCNLLIRC